MASRGEASRSEVKEVNGTEINSRARAMYGSDLLGRRWEKNRKALSSIGMEVNGSVA